MAAREKRWLAVMGLEVMPVDAWRVHAPPGVSTATGALITDLADAGSRYLCADLRYMPPQAGYDVLGVIYGAQPGLSFSGNHYNGGVFDPDTGVQFQEGEKKPDEQRPPKLEGLGPINDDSHDRPIGGVRLIINPGKCLPRTKVIGYGNNYGKQQPSDGWSIYSAGVAEAIERRRKWLESRHSVDVAINGMNYTNSEHLGGWELYRGRIQGGYQFAIAVILSWNCRCSFKSYERWTMPDNKPDNYGPDTSDWKNNNRMMSEIRREGVDDPPEDPTAPAIRGERCYRVFVDSLGRITPGLQQALAGQGLVHLLLYQRHLRGRLTVINPDGKDESAESQWKVTARLRFTKNSGGFVASASGSVTQIGG